MNYTGIANTALKQIADKGRMVTIKTPSSEQQYDPSTDTFTEGTDSEEQVKALFTQFAKKDIDGEMIQAQDKRVLIAASSVTNVPGTDGKIKDGAQTYRVINVDTVQPGDTPILYMVQVRR